VFENRVLRETFGAKRDEVKGEWRKLLNEELNDLYSSPNTVPVIKSRRMRRTGHVALWGRVDVYTGCWWENLRERDHLEDQRVARNSISSWIFRKWDVVSMDWIELAQDRNRWRALVIAVMNLRAP
jgi:hypothetical protein